MRSSTVDSLLLMFFVGLMHTNAAGSHQFDDLTLPLHVKTMRGSFRG